MKISTLDDYINSGSLTERQKEVIIQAVNERKNILIVGKTLSNFANTVINEMVKTGDRLIIIEGSSEIKSKNRFSLKATNHTNANDLLKTALKLRPDRLIVGEVGEEALNMLIGWNSGHPGGLSIIDSEDARGGLKQLEKYLHIKQELAQKLITEAVNLIIVLKKINGIIKIVEITKVIDWKNGEYILEQIA